MNEKYFLFYFILKKFLVSKQTFMNDFCFSFLPFIIHHPHEVIKIPTEIE